MSCLSTAQKARYEAKIATYTTLVVAAETALEEALARPLESYKFDSGEGSQQAKSRKLAELEKTLRSLESRLDYYQNKIDGKGLYSPRFRRKSGGTGRTSNVG